MLAVGGFAGMLHMITNHEAKTNPHFGQRHEEPDDLNVNVDAHYSPPALANATRELVHSNAVKSNAVKTTKTKKDAKKTAKADPKKKTKKKKKSKKINPMEEETIDSADEETETTDSGGSGDVSIPRQLGPIVGATNQFVNNPQTFEEWRDFILNDPTLDKMRKMIDAYASHKISAEIFYGVLEVLIEDSRDSVRDLAVVGYGTTPSAESFDGLARARDHESGKVQEHIDQYLETYTSLTHLSILSQALNSDEVSTIVFAAQFVQKSAFQNLHGGSSPPRSTGRGRNRGNGGQNTVSLSARYTSVVHQLENIRSSSEHEEARRAAQQALDGINGLLGEALAQTAAADPQ